MINNCKRGYFGRRNKDIFCCFNNLMMSFIRVFVVVLLSFFLMNCTYQKVTCKEVVMTRNILNLIKITPFKKIYKEGDEINISMRIPTRIITSSSTVDIYNNTKDINGWLSLVAGDSFFKGNDLVYSTGSSREELEGWFNIPYNFDHKAYEFEMKVKLYRLGKYSINRDANIVFQDESKCNSLWLNTNIDIPNKENAIEFEVQ